MGKPIGAVEQLYDRLDCDGIGVWIDNSIDQEAVKEITIGYRKLLFFSELTLSGISSRVFVK